MCYRAVDADITIVNEVGVDPGIDHMLAMQCFDEVKHSGGRVCILMRSNIQVEGYVWNMFKLTWM